MPIRPCRRVVLADGGLTADEPTRVHLPPRLERGSRGEGAGGEPVHGVAAPLHVSGHHGSSEPDSPS